MKTKSKISGYILRGGVAALVLLCAVLLLWTIDLATSATLTVTNTSDSGAGSLRQTLADANDGDTITFSVIHAITLTSGELVVAKNITINGPGANVLAVSRDPNFAAFSIFHVLPGHTVAISGLTISNGAAPGAVGGGINND